MLGKAKVCAVLAVKDLTEAKEFYEAKLGLSSSGGEDPGGIMYDCGGGTGVFVYESQFAGTNQATAATWTVDDVKAAVVELKDKGIKFEVYDMPNIKREGEIHFYGDKLQSAWFKDPDGNILNIVNM